MILSINTIAVVLSFLDFYDVAKAARVSKKFCKAANMNFIWKDLCLRKWLFNRFRDTWK